MSSSLNAAHEGLDKVLYCIEQVLSDSAVPRNIRKKSEEIKNILLDENEDIKVRAGSALSLLDEISSDRNLPMHLRSLLWSIASELERI